MTNANEMLEEKMNRMLAEKVAKDHAVEVTPEQIMKEAQFLWGWAKSKPITRVSKDSTFFSKGKLMTQLYPAMVQGLLDGGYATGTTRSFVMNKPSK